MTNRLFAVLLLVVLVCSVASIAAMWGEDRGAWSSDWPKELEPYRARASTITEQPIGGGYVYAIPFVDRDDFEKIWPVLVKLKSKGAPLILRSGGVEMKRRWMGAIGYEGKDYSAGWPQGTYAGVKIYAPSQSLYPKGSDAHAGAEAQDRSNMGRSTTVIELFVGDSKVIDLNRIRLPAETPIVDNRVFEHEQKQATTKPSSQ